MTINNYSKIINGSFDITSHDFVKEYWRPKWQEQEENVKREKEKKKEEEKRKKEEEQKKYELTNEEKIKMNSIIENTLEQAVKEYLDGKPLPIYLAKKVIERLRRDAPGIKNE